VGFGIRTALTAGGLEAMRHKSKIREIVHVLIKNRFYLTLPLQERYNLVKYILRRFPFCG
jgi:hypothetical protein